jgi:hypothetical protein
MNKRRHHLLSTAVVVFLGLSTAAGAQTGHTASSPGSVPTNAELQKEIELLRAELRQLQQAQRQSGAHAPGQDGTAGAMGKQGMGMGMGKQGMGMGMGKDCMEKCAAGNGGMEMDEKAMEPTHEDMKEPMPAPSAPADGMGHM